ncbi:MAG: hypothetical protein IKF52_06255 [Clostridia bacterium]|nr:hypothetical protein [Clostridia bacterium]
MQKIKVPPKYNNKKLIPFLQNQYPNLSINEIYKALRKKDIRINNIKTSENQILHENDEITIYITDDIIFSTKINLQKIYEDENILIIDKPAEIEVTTSKNNEQTLTSVLKKEYLYIEPCHRLDRNTSRINLICKRPRNTTNTIE